MHFWSVARYDLGLSDDGFYALTPRQFDALLKRKRVETRNNEFMLANLTSWVANTGFRTTEKPTTWKDFAPSEGTLTAKQSRPRRRTRKLRTAVSNQLRAMFPNLNPKKPCPATESQLPASQS